MLLTSCMYDPYSDQRPADYGEATWICYEYDIWFNVDLEKYDYYCPEGELQINNNKYFCKFYFIHQTNMLSISIYPLEYADLPDDKRDRGAVLGDIDGDCTFSETSFTCFVTEMSGDIFDSKIEKMTFIRTELTRE